MPLPQSAHAVAEIQKALGAESVEQTVLALARVCESRKAAPWVAIAEEEYRPEDKVHHVLFPIKDKTCWEFYKQLESTDWHAEEIMLRVDAEHYRSASEAYKRFYRECMAFFAGGDGVISDGVVAFIVDTSEPRTDEEKAFLTKQLANELVHAETYNLLIHDVIPPGPERDQVMRAIVDLECVKAKGDFVFANIEHPTWSLGRRYLAGAFAEGVFFASLFAMIFYLRDLGVFQGLALANSFIIRDELLHRNFNCEMAVRHKKWSTQEAHAIAREAYRIEVAHAAHILADPVVSREADRAAKLTMENIEFYIMMQVDQILELVGCPGLFEAELTDPVKKAPRAVGDILPWMTALSTELKTNMYEAKTANYEVAQKKRRSGKQRGTKRTRDTPPADDYLDTQCL